MIVTGSYTRVTDDTNIIQILLITLIILIRILVLSSIGIPGSRSYKEKLAPSSTSAKLRSISGVTASHRCVDVVGAAAACVVDIDAGASQCDAEADDDGGSGQSARRASTSPRAPEADAASARLFLKII